MPRSPKPSESFQQAVRFKNVHGPWIAAEMKKLGESFNEIIRRLVDDAMSFYGLPANQRERLEAEMKKLGLDRRDYVQYVLSLRAEALAREQGEKVGKR